LEGFRQLNEYFQRAFDLLAVPIKL
jgi:hypothetical protein